jgi:drug/metabolite transporter (DMT)-like permease
MSGWHLALGVYGLFGFHFLLFIALRHAPPVQANLVNYLWPLGIVVMAPLFLPGVKLSAMHLLAVCMGFAGASIAILGGKSASASSGFAWGYVPAAGSAFIWASYSLMTKRLALQGKSFPTAAIGLFGIVSGLLSLLCHALLEPSVALNATDAVVLLIMGLGPLGAAFYLWDAALKRGDARQIGILSYITPLASTALLLIATGQSLSWSIAAAAALIIGAAVLGMRARS